MTWVKLDDQFFAHPKVIDLGKDAKLLYLAGLTYCSEHLTDGRISPAALRMIAAMVDVSRAAAAELVAAGLWEQTDGVYQVHDYLDHQPPAEAIRRKRDDARERMRHLRNGVNSDECSQDVRANGAVTSQKVSDEDKEVEVDKDVEDRFQKPEAEETESVCAASAASSAPPDPVDWVFGYYREYVQPNARLCPRDKIRARLKRFTPDELTLGVEHFAADGWCMKYNAHRGADWFFRTDARSEQFLAMDPQPLAEERAPRRLHA